LQGIFLSKIIIDKDISTTLVFLGRDTEWKMKSSISQPQRKPLEEQFMLPRLKAVGLNKDV
jgi:hypothetical protein